MFFCLTTHETLHYKVIILDEFVQNWRTQIRKGYLELCLLLLIQKKKRMYGFEILEEASKLKLDLKEGTIYPLLNRLTQDEYLEAVWETEGIKGHPRKFYSLSKTGKKRVSAMAAEFETMMNFFNVVRSERQ